MKTRALSLPLALSLWAFPAFAGGPRVLYDDVNNEYDPLPLPTATTANTSAPTTTTTTTTSPTTTTPTDTGNSNSGTHDNRSGLGDGTNPGAGAEHNAGNNQGTLNPGGSKKK